VFGFETIGELSGDKPWKGTVKTEGTLRLVATGPGCIYAVAFELKSSDR